MLWRSSLRSIQVPCQSSTLKLSPASRRRGLQSNVKLPPRYDHATLLRGGGSDDFIRISGLVRSTRKHKSVAFVWVNDGSTLANIQAILTPQLAKDIDTGAYVSLVGKWIASPGAGQKHEFAVDQVAGIGPGNASVRKKTFAVGTLC
jgi:phage-related tail fiber protein